MTALYILIVFWHFSKCALVHFYYLYTSKKVAAFICIAMFTQSCLLFCMLDDTLTILLKNYGRSIGIWKKERNWYGIERMLWVCWYKSITMILKTIILFSVAPTRIVPCSDKLTNCDEYPPDLCTNELYRLWREDNCRKFCGICSGIRHVTVRAMKH